MSEWSFLISVQGLRQWYTMSPNRFWTTSNNVAFKVFTLLSIAAVSSKRWARALIDSITSPADALDELISSKESEQGNNIFHQLPLAGGEHLRQITVCSVRRRGAFLEQHTLIFNHLVGTAVWQAHRVVLEYYEVGCRMAGSVWNDHWLLYNSLFPSGFSMLPNSEYFWKQQQ